MAVRKGGGKEESARGGGGSAEKDPDETGHKFTFGSVGKTQRGCGQNRFMCRPLFCLVLNNCFHRICNQRDIRNNGKFRDSGRGLAVRLQMLFTCVGFSKSEPEREGGRKLWKFAEK